LSAEVQIARIQDGALDGRTGKAATDSLVGVASDRLKSTVASPPYSLRHQERRRMNRKAVAVLAACVAIALAVAGAAFSRSSSTPTLKGVVGPGFTIKLTKGGTKVKTLKAGKYRIVISDKSDFHNFTLEREKPSKPKLEKTITSTAMVGSRTIVWTLKPGSWRAYCSIHEAQMHQDFKVTR
jgi:hypothetical protein